MDNVRSPHNTPLLSELVRRAQSGDDNAFDQLAGGYRAAVLAVTFSHVGNLEDAEDLAQETLIRAREKLPALKEPDAFPAWLKMIALNACRTWYRRSRPWPESLDATCDSEPIPDPDPQPLEALLQKERQREWRRALVTLPAANRLALLMSVWGEYSYEDIASFVGVPVTTVVGRIYRAKTQLRRILRSKAAELLGEPRRQWKQEDDTE